MSSGVPLPVHGFVLAGGKSSRMGRDKALLSLSGKPLVEIATAKLRTFCSAVSIAGNRDDLQGFAPVVSEVRLEIGPAAGFEAGLHASSEPWALFLPVDVPLVPVDLLKNWADAVLGRNTDGVRMSFLRAHGMRQPTFCLMHKACAAVVTAAVERGDRKLGVLFDEVASVLGSGTVWMAEAEAFLPAGSENGQVIEVWFSNVNTPGDLESLETWVRTQMPLSR